MSALSRLVMARAWLILACMALIPSGVLSIIITAAKIPLIKHLVNDLSLIRWFLVIHVNLAVLVWFTALPPALLQLVRTGEDEAESSATWMQIFGFFLSCAGILLFVSAVPGPTVESLLVNYVPVVTHPRFYLGIVLYGAGVLLNYLDPRMLLLRIGRSVEGLPGLVECRFGLWIGTLFFLLAVLTFAVSFAQVKTQAIHGYNIGLFEIMMWGGGHMLQHSSTVFLVVAWILLFSNYLRAPAFSRRELFKVFAWLGLPILAAPLLLSWSSFSAEYRMGFTSLMRWGIFPPVLLLLMMMVRKIRRQRIPLFGDYRMIGLVLSIVLLLLGFVFGALIRGADLRVPGHYHAGIGAVTLGFIALSFLLLTIRRGNAPASLKWIRRSTWIYGVGQIMFSSGMFIAGSFGVGRKTYGSEHTLTHWGQFLGFGVMGVGGLIALSGGICFAIAILPQIRRDCAASVVEIKP